MNLCAQTVESFRRKKDRIRDQYQIEQVNLHIDLYFPYNKDSSEQNVPPVPDELEWIDMISILAIDIPGIMGT